MGHHVIENFDTLATTPLRRDALLIAEAGYNAINVGSACIERLSIKNDILSIDGVPYSLAGRHLFFVGVGKCAFAASLAIEEICGDRLAGGIALDVSPLEEGQSLTTIQTFVGTHPLPSDANEHATKQILEFLSERTEDDLVLMLISGGGSTLLCLPPSPMTPADESVVWSELTAKGVRIQDMNTVRKHISRARGGALSAAAFPAEVVALVVSDVPGNDIEYISSGPTVRDTSTSGDAEAILKRYTISPSVYQCIETPKDEKFFKRVSTRLFLTNRDALTAMHQAAVSLGYTATIVDDMVTGDVREVGRALLENLHAMPSKTVLVSAGETTVTLGETHGKGGRNQEMALAALGDIRDDELILPFASDGHDNTNVAGAVSDATTREHAREHRLSIDEYLSKHCSYNFFAITKDALVTGYTGSNVSDLIIAMKK